MKPCAGTTSTTQGSPWVIVPVLSSTTTETSLYVWNEAALRIRMPWRAASPPPRIMASGVAIPSAHG